jgi:molecular chaperone GrpE
MRTHERTTHAVADIATSPDKDLHLLGSADFDGEIEGLNEKLSQERERHLRTLADFKNYRRRMERDGNKIADAGKREMFLPLLAIVDDLEKALQWANGDAKPLMAGLKIIHQKALALLEAQGVRPFESLGKQFTPDLHEAVALAKADGAGEGIVVDDLRRGYLWRDELLRPAQVRVSG